MALILIYYFMYTIGALTLFFIMFAVIDIIMQGIQQLIYNITK